MVTEHRFDGITQLAYSSRGWCTFEETTSAILKPSHGILDICSARERLAVEYAKWFEEDSLAVLDDCNIVAVYLSLEELATAARPPPMHPSDFKNMISQKHFTYPADNDLVTKFYRLFFLRMCHRQTMLMLCNASGTSHGWERAQAICLAKALPAFKQLKTLSINGHSIGDDGVQALATAMVGLKLKHLFLTKCTIGEPGLRSISNVLPKLKSLRLLVLPRALQECDASKVLRTQWTRCGKPACAEFDTDGWPRCGMHWLQSSAKDAPRASMEALTLGHTV